MENCADVCPAKEKALVMKPLETQTEKEIPNWDYAISSVSDKGHLVEGKTVKDSQFKCHYMNSQEHVPVVASLHTLS